MAGGVSAAEAMIGMRDGLAALAAAAGPITMAVRGASEAAERFGKVWLSLELPEPHAFTPDLDLRCTVRHCTLEAEEHSLW